MYTECLTSHLGFGHKLDEILTVASKRYSYNTNSLSQSKSAIEAYVTGEHGKPREGKIGND